MTRILINERDEAIATLLQTTLCRLVDCDVHVAHDPASAAEALGSKAFELILLDVGMYSDGFDTLRRIRGRNEDSEVIALTTGAIAGSMLKALADADVFAVISKPFDLGQLTEVVLESLRPDRRSDPNRPLIYRQAGSEPTLD